MPGIVSLQTPHEAPPSRITVTDEGPSGIGSSTGRSDPVHPRVQPKQASSSSSTSRVKPPSSGKKKSPAEDNSIDESSPLDNPDLGPFLLKLARETIANGDGPYKALEYALRAAKSFEACAPKYEPSLDLAMSLHVVAAIYCSLNKFEEAIPVLERAIKVPDVSIGSDHALATFSGYMQLGDTHSMLGHLDRSIEYYNQGLKIQIDALGDSDPRVGETCRYLAEAYVQGMQFKEAENLCTKTLEIHKIHSPPGSIEEAADRRLMALILEAKGEYEQALEHLVLASMAMTTNQQDTEIAAIDVTIGNIYTSLSRFDEAIFSYQKALTVFKSSKGENHPTVASVYIRLSDISYKTGKLRESRNYCENALTIYQKPVPGTTQEDLASGLTEIATIYEQFNEPEESMKLLKKALKLLSNKPSQLSIIAGIEVRMGVMLYMIGKYEESRNYFEKGVQKLRAIGERKSSFFGIILNQMGLACVQLFKIDEAADLFEEAREILERECGIIHQDTLGVCSNLAATYDAMGRVEDAIEILENVLKLREEKLGTANTDFEDEKKRLNELLKEVGRWRKKKEKSLENLIDDPNLIITNNSKPMKKQTSRRWSAPFRFKS